MCLDFKYVEQRFVVLINTLESTYFKLSVQKIKKLMTMRII